LVDEIVAVRAADFRSDGESVRKVAVTSSIVQSDNMPAANINPE
jgi:hypothetical protein